MKRITGREFLGRILEMTPERIWRWSKLPPIMAVEEISDRESYVGPNVHDVHDGGERKSRVEDQVRVKRGLAAIFNSREWIVVVFFIDRFCTHNETIGF